MSKVRMFDHDDPDRGDDRPASPRTTIVGGQPPRSAAGLPPVPTGMEKLLRLASVDEAFRQVLLEQRGDAAEAAGVELTPSERAILAAVPEGQLAAMAQQIPPPAPERRDFLRQAAASAVVALGGAALASCDGTPIGATRGIQPDMPPPRQDGGTVAHPPPPPRPDEPSPPQMGSAPDVPPPRPDRVDPSAGEMADPPPPPRPDGPPPPGGIQPDMPPPRPEKNHTPGRGGSAPDMP